MSIGKRLLAVTLALILALSLANMGAMAESKKEDVLKVGVGSILATLDPAYGIGIASMAIFYNIFDLLVESDPTAADGVKGVLATAWTKVDDTTWDFTIRQGVTFHDGEACTADDVVFTFERILDPNYGDGTIRTLFSTIDNVSKVDDYTIRFTTKNPDPVFLQRLSSVWGAYIVPKDYITKVGNEAFQQAPIGTGPYMVKEFTPDKVVISAYDGFWGDKPNAQSVEYIKYQETATRITALITGEVDMIAQVTPDMLPTVEADPNLSVVGGEVLNIHTVVFYGNTAPMNDVNFRLALTHSVDRELLVETLWNGKTSVPNGHQFAAYGDSYISDYQGIAYDVEKAKEYLAKSSYKGETIKYTIPNGYYTNGNAAAEAVVAMWNAIGIKAEVDVRDTFKWDEVTDMRTWSTASRMNDILGGVWMLWAPSSNPQKFAWLNGMPEGWLEVGEKLTKETDPAARKELIRQMLTVWDQQAMGICLYNNAEFFGMRKGITWKPSIDQRMNFRADNLKFN
jgi:peptide/nickel transport system substrate-binding protein